MGTRCKIFPHPHTDAAVQHCSLILPTLCKLQQNDTFLLQKDINERAITHKMGMYAEETVRQICELQGVLPPDVDCEYCYHLQIPNNINKGREDQHTNAKQEWLIQERKEFFSSAAKLLKQDCNFLSFLLLLVPVWEIVELFLLSLQGFLDSNGRGKTKKTVRNIQQALRRRVFDKLLKALNVTQQQNAVECSAKYFEIPDKEELVETIRNPLLNLLDETELSKKQKQDLEGATDRLVKNLSYSISLIYPPNIRKYGTLVRDYGESLKNRRPSEYSELSEEEIEVPPLTDSLRSERQKENGKTVKIKKYPDIVLHSRNERSIFYIVEVKKLEEELSTIICNLMKSTAKEAEFATKVSKFLTICLHDLVKIKLLQEQYGREEFSHFAGSLVILRTGLSDSPYPDPVGNTQIAAIPSYPVACIGYPFVTPRQNHRRTNPSRRS